MQQQDMQQISSLLVQKLKENNKSLSEKIDKKFEENNKFLSEKIDKKFEENNKFLSEKIDKKFEENNKFLKTELKTELGREIVDEIGVIFNQSFNELEAKIDLIDEKLNKVVDKDDKIIKKHQDFDVELASNQGAHDRLNKKIDGHEIRLKKLELPA